MSDMVTNSTQYNDKVYSKYWWNKKAMKARASRNNVRRKAIKSGAAAKWDGMDMHHIDGNPLNDSPKNIKKITMAKNRKLGAAKATRAKKKKGTDLFYV